MHAGESSVQAVVQTADGGYTLAGNTGSFGAGGLDGYLVKTDSNGNMEWNQTYGGTSSEVACDLVKTMDGGYALAGQTNSFGAGGPDFWLVKTDSVGNVVPGFKFGLAWTDSTANSLTLYKGLNDSYWNYVRVRIWKIKE